MLASHLIQNILTEQPELKANRVGFGEGLLEAGGRDERVVALCADLTESTRVLPFAEKYPERFVQVGITEQNMASVASGMAAMGKIPFIASYAMFSPGRNWEQIRTTIAYNDVPVKIIGAHSGVSVGPDGATHQAIEDIAIMRVVPNMVVIAPADVHEARKATLLAAKYPGPVYIRLGRSDTPVVTTVESPFAIGVAEVLYTADNSLTGDSIGLIVTGTLLHNALMAASELEKAGVPTSVLHVPTIKPLDTEAVEKFATEHTHLITIEEHQIAGGLGGAVVEHLTSVRLTRVTRLGVHDQFGQSGEPDELIAHYGMDTKTIFATAQKLRNP